MTGMKRLCAVFVVQGALALAQQSSPPSSSALDRMVAAGKSQRELGQHVFDTHGCRTCHTMGHDGELGFTDRGKQRAKGFEGCINMLTAMTVIVQLPEDRRSPEQRQKAVRFAEFGCTTCHMLSPGKLELTEVGAKLKHLHLGCVEVETLVAAGPSAQR
jgi:cytochrome c2